MKKISRFIIIFLFIFFLNLKVTYAYSKVEMCYVSYNAQEINNTEESLKSVLSRCGITDTKNLTNGKWSITKQPSNYIKVDTTLEKVKFYNIDNLYRNWKDSVSLTFVSNDETVAKKYYDIIFGIKPNENHIRDAKCCTSIDTDGKVQYFWDENFTSCHVVHEITEKDVCLAKNNVDTAIKEDKEVCILTGKTYHWGKLSSIQAGSKEVPGLTKDDCNTKMLEQAEKDNKEGNERVEKLNAEIAAKTSDTGYKNTGKAACQNYTVTRARIYNPKSDNPSDGGNSFKFPYAKSNYFKSPVTTESANYYNVYKATCEDKNEPVSTFCIDPGLTGPLSTPIHYTPSDTIDPNSKLGKGIYRLYAYWYNEGEGRNKILSANPTLSENSGGFSTDTVNSDYVDYIVNNVARLLVYNYGKSNNPAIKFECEANDKGCSFGWSKDEIKYYSKKNFDGKSNTDAKSKEILQTVWQDVTDFIANGSVITSNSSIYTMPIEHFDYIVGDFDGATATKGYYCGLTSNHHRNPDGTIYKEHFGNSNYKHNGIDFVASTGTEVYAATSGTIIKVFNYNENCYKKSACENSDNKVGLGYKVKNDDGTYSLYMHMDKLYKTNGARIEGGELIGTVGNTGEAQAAHLHYEMRGGNGELGTNIINARAYLPMDGIETCAIDAWKKGSTPETSSSFQEFNKSKLTSVEIKTENVSSSVNADRRGFEASFDAVISSKDDISAIDSIAACTDPNSANCGWKITAVTDTNVEIPINSSNITLVNNNFEKTSNSIRKGSFKVSVPDGLVSVIDSASKVKIKFTISYKSIYSVDNILLLTTSENSVKNGRYQRFLTFLNGKIERTVEVNIDVPDAEKDECNPMFSMMCTPINTVSYLIEGTQSPEIFNSIMSGINTVGDLVKVVNKSTEILDRLKNKNLTSNDVLYVASLSYNIAGNLLNFTTIQKQLEDFLNLPELKDNQTAQRLKNAIVKDTTIKTYLKSEKVDTGLWCTIKGWFGADGKCYGDVEHTEYIEDIPDYSKNEPRAFTDFASMLANVIKGDNANYQSIKNDWKQLFEVSKTYSKQYNKIPDFVSTIQNFVNGMKSKENLNRVLDGLTSFGGLLNDGNIFSKTPTLQDIKDTVQSLSTAVQGTFQTAASTINDTISQLKNIVSNLDPKNMDLSDVSDVLSLFTKATTTDWEKCIIGKNDPNGNSYEVQAENLYCSISCKEDYAFKMPGNLGTVAPGQNLTTNIDNVYQATVGVAGQRTCVTTSIDNNAYVTDAFNKKQEILKDYNELLKLYNQQSAILSQADNIDPTASALHPAQKTSIETIGTDEVQNLFKQVKGDLEDLFKRALGNFATKLLGGNVKGQVVDNLKAEMLSKCTDIIYNMGGTIIANIMNGEKDISKIISLDTIKTELEKTLQEEKEKYKENFDAGVESAVTTLKEGVKDVATNALKKVGTDALELGVATVLTVGCHSTKALSGIPYVGPFLAAAGEAICETYAAVSTAIGNAVPVVSNATGGIILGYYTPANNGIYYYTSEEYNYGESTFATLNTCDASYAFENDDNYYINILKGDIVCTKAGNQEKGQIGSNELFLPIIAPGSYEPSVLHFGFTLDINKFKRGIEQIQSLSKKLPELSDDIKSFLSFEDSSFIKVLESIKSPSLSGLSDFYHYVKSGDFGSDANSLQKVIPTIFNYIAENSTHTSVAITELIDTSLNAIYNLFGGLSPYYGSLANVNNSLLDMKAKYNSAVDELGVLAKNMHDCTVWSNDFSFDPKITFNYGYRYMGAFKDATTESIDLEPINKQEAADEIFYYCDEDVKINDIQSLNTIFSGKCTTSDGVLGSILSVFLGDNETFQAINSFIENNSNVIRNFLKNDKIKEFIGEDGYNKICVFGGENLCAKGDDLLMTGIPGSIIYKMNANASFGTTINSIVSSVNLNSLKDGTILAKLINAIRKNFIYGATATDDVSYRNVGRVVRVSRYGNPGVSISGLSMKRFIENMVTYVANYMHVERDSILDKIYKAAMKINGEGAQEFVYFRSSKPYFTYSNKGIYTNNPNAADDTIAIDYGDKGLTNDTITSGTEAAKQATGKSYPIALSTEPGTYYYNITFNNIGQYYNNTFSLGRIVDDSGYINGTMASEYSCYYNVEKPTVDNRDECEKLIENASAVCKTEDNKFYKDLYKANYNTLNGEDYKAKWSTCINKLLAGGNKTCCDYIKDAIPDTAEAEFKRVCYERDCEGIGLFACINNKNSICDGLSVDSKEYDKTNTGTASTGNKYELISGNGSLSFYTKIVSNYDLFPNGEKSKGLNWVGITSGNENRDDAGNKVPEKLNDVITEIERKGDNIYDEEPDYYIELDGACMSKIREYNNQSELYDLGFGDYSGSSKNKETRAWEASFLNDLEQKSEYKECAEAIKNNLSKKE